MFNLDKPSAEEFLEVYKTLIPEYPEMVSEMTMGPCIAIEIRLNINDLLILDKKMQYNHLDKYVDHMILISLKQFVNIQ